MSWKEKLFIKVKNNPNCLLPNKMKKYSQNGSNLSTQLTTVILHTHKTNFYSHMSTYYKNSTQRQSRSPTDTEKIGIRMSWGYGITASPSNRWTCLSNTTGMWFSLLTYASAKSTMRHGLYWWNMLKFCFPNWKQSGFMVMKLQLSQKKKCKLFADLNKLSFLITMDWPTLLHQKPNKTLKNSKPNHKTNTFIYNLPSDKAKITIQIYDRHSEMRYFDIILTSIID